MKIVTVTGYKGGVGKSTTAVHLATYFSDCPSGHSKADRANTILVDGDPNRTALSWASRGGFAFEVVDSRQAMKVINKAEYVVIDTPARPDSDDLKELSKGCDLLILPTKPDIVSLEPMLEMVKDLGKANFRCLLTIVAPHPSKEGATLREELIKGGVPVFKSMIRRTSGFEKAAMEGVAIRDVKDSRLRLAWRDYIALGTEVMEVLG